jgi:hypothetical protein
MARSILATAPRSDVVQLEEARLVPMFLPRSWLINAFNEPSPWSSISNPEYRLLREKASDLFLMVQEFLRLANSIFLY